MKPAFAFQTLHEDPQGNFSLIALKESLSSPYQASDIAQALKKNSAKPNFLILNRPSDALNDNFPCLIFSENRDTLKILEMVLGGSLNQNSLSFEIKAGSQEQAKEKLVKLAQAAFIN
jgi:hypothetical protein